MNREEARKLFENSGLKYSDIGSIQIAQLIKCIKEELQNFNNNGFVMELNPLKRNDIEYKEDGSIKNCYFKAKGIIKGCNNGSSKDIIHFKEREAISFNTQGIEGNGFIGFSGWADDKNLTPFISAFIKWVSNLT